MKAEEHPSEMNVRLNQQLLGIDDLVVLSAVQAILKGADQNDRWGEDAEKEARNGHKQQLASHA